MQHLRIQRRFPVLSILALLSAALFFFGSMPIWNPIVWSRINTAEYNSEDAKEDAGRFGSRGCVTRRYDGCHGRRRRINSGRDCTLADGIRSLGAKRGD